SCYAYCSSRAALRERAAKILWRHRTGSVLSHRGIGSAGPRRDALCKRRFGDKAHLVAACRRSLRMDKHCVDRLAHHMLMLENVVQRAAEFDLVHFHTGYLHFPLSRREQIRHVTTLHGPLDLPDLVPLYQEFRTLPVIP